MTRDEFTAWATARGYQPDESGDLLCLDRLRYRLMPRNVLSQIRGSEGRWDTYWMELLSDLRVFEGELWAIRS